MAANFENIRIHPGMGLARLGNSDEYYLGPEAPGIVVDPGGVGGPGPNGGTYRDCQNRLKRQAQRFRIYAQDQDGKTVEITNDSPGVKEIVWRVHVRNMKAANYAFQGAYLFNPNDYRNPNIQGDKTSPIDRDKLIIDPGPVSLSASDEQPVILAGDIFNDIGESELPGYLRFANMEQKTLTNEKREPVKVTYTGAKDIELGQLRLDEQQRLIFVPAPGKAECVTTPKVELSNPSEFFDAPNGPDNGEDPLTNQFAYFNVPGWWDDTCGGEIDATVVFDDGATLSTRNEDGSRNPLQGGWVVSAPPKFAPNMYHVVSLLDRVYEAFPESDPNQGKPTNFYRDVYPILSKACNYGWVSAEASGVEPSTRNMAHGPKQGGNLLSPKNLAVFTDKSSVGAPARKQIFAIMRQAERSDRSGKFPKLIDTLPIDPPPIPSGPPPTPERPPRPTGEGPVSRGNQMPKLWGTGGKPLQNQELGHNLPNEYLSLTDWQLARMAEWAAGDFEVGTLEAPKVLEDYPLDEQPHALDASALEPTIGGGFHPGIEFPYLILYKEYFADAFRVQAGVEPGQLAAYMSSPWQGDYWSCNVAWWPVQRPDIVFQYNAGTDTRTYREWFRGFDASGNPLSSSDGYDQMVYAWPKLGMVLPTKDPDTGEYITSNGQPVFQEFERDPSLNLRPVQESKVKLGNSAAAMPSSADLPHMFYSNTTDFFILPNWVSIKLAGNSTGTAPVYVDDEVTIMMKTQYGEWQTVYQHDFSQGDSGDVQPLPPVDLTCVLKDFVGQTVQVKINYTDLYPDSEGASEFWLCFSPG